MSTTRDLPIVKSKIVKIHQSENCENTDKSDILKCSAENHILRKRVPERPQAARNVIYVNTKTNFNAILGHCFKLVRQDHKEIIIYCLGAAIERGATLALQICDKYANYQMDVNTYSTILIDDVEPLIDDADYDIQKRYNSALRIRLCRIEPLEVEQLNKK